MILASPVGKDTIYLSQSGVRWYRSQRFGCTGVVYERPLGNCAHFHRGIDIARSNGGCGDPLLAAQAGTIHFAGKLPGGPPSYGAIVVEINHGSGIFTAYSHLTTEIVKVGQKVAKGQKIGTLGKTGNATGCHVHFALKTGVGPGSVLDDGNGTWADPWPQLAQNVTVHPKEADGIRIRTTPVLSDATIYAETHAGHIHRKSDNADLGIISQARDWDWPVQGAEYTVGGQKGTSWDRIYMDGAYRYIATPLAVRSAN